MKPIFVYDQAIDQDALDKFCMQKKIGKADILSLTGRSDIVKDAETSFRKNISDAVFLESAKMVESEIIKLRKAILKWSADMGDAVFFGKTVKEWFLLPGCGVSAWWFGLISEKNTFKTDSFLRIAQINAVKGALSAKSYDVCVTAISDRRLRWAVKAAAEEAGIAVLFIPNRRDAGFNLSARALIECAGAFGHMVLGGLFACRFFIRGSISRKYLGRYDNRLPDSKSVIFVTYFPGFDPKAAESGIYINRYAYGLQDKLEENGISIVWALMYASIDGHSFLESAKAAANFARNGARVVMLEEFFGIKDFVISISLWVRQIFVAHRLFKKVIQAYCRKGEPGYELRPFVKDLWFKSFYGPKGIDGIMHFFAFKKMLVKAGSAAHCVYCCEMQASEKALNAAKRRARPTLKTIGFQHSAVSRNYFFYFYDNKEIVRSGKDTDMPLPDTLCANSEPAYSIFKESGYENVSKVEALRYGHLEKILCTKPVARKGKPVLLIAGSIDRSELKNVISMVHEAFPDNKNLEVWFKWHPHMAGKNIFNEMGVDIERCGYLVKNEDLSKCLESAWAVMAPTGAASIEALAFGCEAILPVFPDAVSMSPLADYEEYYHKARSAADLRAIVLGIAGGKRLHTLEEYREFVKGYFYADSSLSRWLAVLNVNDARLGKPVLRACGGCAQEKVLS